VTVDVVLIGGPARSGTGLARRLVGSHPDVAIPPFELGLMRARESGVPIQDVIDGLRPQLDRLGVSVDDLGEVSLAQLLNELLDRTAQAAHRPIPGEKTPGNEHHLDTYRTWLPGRTIGFVHMIRDPHNVVASHLHARWNTVEQTNELVASLAEDWVASARIASRTPVAEQPTVVVRYEDLTSDPAAVARRVCHAFGLPERLDEMVAMSSYPRHVNSSFDSIGEPTAGGVHASVDRISHLTPDEQEIVSSITAAAAEPHGYTTR